jgi:hypothetical protein
MRKEGSSAESRLGLPEYRGHSLAEKFAFALLILFVLAALLGLFGDGPLSAAVASSNDGQLRVDYQRFCRRHAQQTLDITLPTQAGAGYVELSINSDYLRRVQVTEILPHPVQSIQHQTGQMRFATDGSGQPMTVRFHLEPQQAGVQQAHLTIGTGNQGREVHFQQLVYP